MVNRRIRLLGPPVVEQDGHDVAGPTGHKAWGVLAHVALADRPPARTRTAAMLFPDARDARRALRWNLTELRPLLGDTGELGGDPLRLVLGADDELDVALVLAGTWPDPAHLGGLGGQLLEGLDFDGAPAFAAWLDRERHHLHAVTGALLGEMAVDAAARADQTRAADLALRGLQLDPFDVERHVLLVEALVAGGDVGAARRHVEKCTQLFRDELGASLPDPIGAALAGSDTSRSSVEVPASASAAAALEAGRAAVAAGAVAHGLTRLQEAVALTPVGDALGRARALVELGSALIHTGGDRSLAAARYLQEGHLCAERAGAADPAAHAARELGFLHVQVGRSERAEVWLDRAEAWTDDPRERSRVLGIRGMSRSDTGRYADALACCEASIDLAERCGHQRSAAWSRSMIGRVHLLRGDLTAAMAVLDRASDDVARERWTAFGPWVDALWSEVAWQAGRKDAARHRLEAAYALAGTLGDHCWLAMTARGLARARADDGDLPGALAWAEDSVGRPPWYLWVHGYALRTAVDVAEAAGDPRADAWQQELARTTGQAQLRFGPADPTTRSRP